MADDGDLIPTTDEDEAARLAEELPPVTASRRRRSREVMSCRARTDRRPRCAACGYFFSSIDSWTCPRCAADLREVGFTRPVSLRSRIASQLRAVVRRLRRKPRNGMACGKCEYPTRGVGGFECPECGSDLRRVGIIDRDRIHRGAVITITLVPWTLALIVLAVLLSDWLSSWAIPQRLSRRTYVHLLLVTFKSDTPAQRSVEMYSVDIYGRGAAIDWRWSGTTLKRMTVAFRRGSGRFAVIDRNIEEDRFTVTTGIVGDLSGDRDRTEVEGTWFDRAVVIDAMRRSGLNVDDPDTQAQGGEIMSAILAIEKDRFEPSIPQYFSATERTSKTMEPSKAHRIYIELFWLGAWAIGSAIIGWLLCRWGRRWASPPSAVDMSAPFP